MNNEQLSENLEKIVIDIILHSPLNISVIPDEIERELYENIFNAIEEYTQEIDSRRCFSKIKKCFTRK